MTDPSLSGSRQSGSHDLFHLNMSVQDARVPEPERSDDELFCEMMLRQLRKIPEGKEKDIFKVNMYAFVINNMYCRSYSSDC